MRLVGGVVRGQFLSAADREALDRFPTEIDPEELALCFWLTDHDHHAVVSRRYGAGGRLAAALQLGAIRLLGFVPSDLATAPTGMVRFVADQVSAATAANDTVRLFGRLGRLVLDETKPLGAFFLEDEANTLDGVEELAPSTAIDLLA